MSVLVSMEVDRDRGPVTEFVDLRVQYQVLDLCSAEFFNSIRSPPQEERDIALALPLGIGQAEVFNSPASQLVHRSSMRPAPVHSPLAAMRDMPTGLQRTQLAHLTEVRDAATAEYEPREIGDRALRPHANA